MAHRSKVTAAIAIAAAVTVLLGCSTTEPGPDADRRDASVAIGTASDASTELVDVVMEALTTVVADEDQSIDDVVTVLGESADALRAAASDIDAIDVPEPATSAAANYVFGLGQLAGLVDTYSTNLSIADRRPEGDVRQVALDALSALSTNSSTLRALGLAVGTLLDDTVVR